MMKELIIKSDTMSHEMLWHATFELKDIITGSCQMPNMQLCIVIVLIISTIDIPLMCQQCIHYFLNVAKTKNNRSNRKAMNRNWSNQKANPALKIKTGNK